MIENAEQWKDLANAVVLQAVEDYQVAWQRIWRFKAITKKQWYVKKDPALLTPSERKQFETYTKKHEHGRKHGAYMCERQQLKLYVTHMVKQSHEDRAMINECIRFFRGEWFRLLTEVDGIELETKLYRKLMRVKAKKKGGKKR